MQGWTILLVFKTKLYKNSDINPIKSIVALNGWKKGVIMSDVFLRLLSYQKTLARLADQRPWCAFSLITKYWKISVLCWFNQSKTVKRTEFSRFWQFYCKLIINQCQERIICKIVSFLPRKNCLLRSYVCLCLCFCAFLYLSITLQGGIFLASAVCPFPSFVCPPPHIQDQLGQSDCFSCT